MRDDLFTPFIEDHGRVVLDGGLATALEDQGHVLDDRLWSAALLRDAPDAIVAVHRAYLDVGADCITTASYQASIPGFVEAGFSDDEAVGLLERASKLAIAARDAHVAARDDSSRARGEGGDGSGPSGGPGLQPLVAASVGPYGAYLADGSEYDGRYPGVSLADLERFHRRRLEILAGSGVDLLACETVPSGREGGVLVDLLSSLDGDVRAWISFACRDGARLHDGAPIEEAAALGANCERVVAVGVNCTAPEHVAELVARIRTVYEGHVIVYPNSGERYDATTGSWSGGAEAAGGAEWIGGVLEAAEVAADILGGCCRVGPDGIAELRRRLGA